MTESRYRWFVAMGLLAEPRATRRRPSPPGPGGAALPAGLLPGRASHRGHEGPDLDRAGQASRGRRLGPGTRRVRHGRRQLSAASSTTSPSCVCSSRSTGNPDSGALDQAAGLLDRLLAAAETSGRAGSSARDPHAAGARHRTRRDIGRRPWSAWPEPWREAPEPEGYVRLFLDEGAPMLSLLRDAAQHGAAAADAAAHGSAPAQPRRSSRSRGTRPGARRAASVRPSR